MNKPEKPIKLIEVWQKDSRRLTRWIDHGGYYEFLSGFTYAPDAYPEPEMWPFVQQPTAAVSADPDSPPPKPTAAE